MANNADGSGFDIYGMLTVLTTLMLASACFLLYDDLSSKWGFTMFGDKPKEQAWHLTELRPVNVNLPIVKLRKEDLDEWNRISEDIKKGKEFPKKNYEWPAGYDPVQFPIKPSTNAWDMTKDPTEGEKWKTALEALIAASAEPEAPKAPEPPKAEEKKDDAAKAPEAPKAPDAPKAGEEKK